MKNVQYPDHQPDRKVNSGVTDLMARMQNAHLSISWGLTQQRSIDMSGKVGPHAYFSQDLAYLAKSERSRKDVVRMYRGKYLLMKKNLFGLEDLWIEMLH